MDEIVLKGKTILVVDDEADLREIVASELEYMGATILQAENVPGAKEVIADHTIDLIVSDIRMPGGTGIDLLNYIKARKTNVPPIILITGFADITIEDAFNQGAEALLSKPFKLEDLIQTAVKLTSTPDQRYVESEPVAPKNLNFSFKEGINKDSIGRGGMAVTVDASNFKWDAGDILKFDLKFNDVELKGQGICRWWKPVDNATKATIGLEFTQLSDTTLSYLKDHWQDQSIVPFIPSVAAIRHS